IREHSLEHFLEINNVRIATELAARKNGFTIEQWIDEPTLKRTHVRMIVPDGYFVLTGTGHRHFQFIELDRATETGLYTDPGGKDWGKKVDGYLSLFREGTFQKMYQAPSFRVLTITTGEKRLANLKR